MHKCLIVIGFSMSLFATVSSASKVQDEYNTYMAIVDSCLMPMYNFEFFNGEEPIMQKHSAAERLVALYTNYWMYLADDDGQHRVDFNLRVEEDFSYSDFKDENAELALLSENLIRLRFAKARGNYWSSIILLNQIGEYFNANPPDTSRALSSLYWGLYNYFFALAKDESILLRGLYSHWVVPSRMQGIKELDSLTNNPSRFISTEARYFLMRAYWEVEERPEDAMMLVNSLLMDYPHNLLYQRFKIGILIDVKGEVGARTYYENCLSAALQRKADVKHIALFKENVQELFDN